MKIAVVHALPLEYYPPAKNLIGILASEKSWEVSAWSTPNRRNLPEWTISTARVARIPMASPDSVLPLRIAGYLRWHTQAALSLAAWRPHAIISIEPHSALAVWLCFRMGFASPALFIHHHEYYAPEDFAGGGKRLLRATRGLERRDLFSRALWVSQTNEQRVRLLLRDSPSLSPRVAHAMPNYPPESWVNTASSIGGSPPGGILRLVYVGAASFEDTFIREAVEWAVAHRDRVSLHVCGDNIQPDVVRWIRSLDSPAVTVNDKGVDYDALPSLLSEFDVGLVLYRGNTLNFVHNVPNKAIEYLACGLQVWYPGVMQGMVSFHQQNPQEDVREMDFQKLPDSPPDVMRRRRTAPFPFTAGNAVAPLLAELRSVESRLR